MTIHTPQPSRAYNRVPHAEELGEIAGLLLNTPFLTVEEERELAQRASAGDEAAAGRLVSANSRNVRLPATRRPLAGW